MNRMHPHNFFVICRQPFFIDFREISCLLETYLRHYNSTKLLNEKCSQNDCFIFNRMTLNLMLFLRCLITLLSKLLKFRLEKNNHLVCLTTYMVSRETVCFQICTKFRLIHLGTQNQNLVYKTLLMHCLLNFPTIINLHNFFMNAREAEMPKLSFL